MYKLFLVEESKQKLILKYIKKCMEIKFMFGIDRKQITKDFYAN